MCLAEEKMLNKFIEECNKTNTITISRKDIFDECKIYFRNEVARVILFKDVKKALKEQNYIIVD